MHKYVRFFCIGIVAIAVSGCSLGRKKAKPDPNNPNNNVPGCSLSYADARDFQVILSTLNIRVGFPFMFADNGLPLTPDSDLKEFKAQLDKGTHKLFWSPEVLIDYPASLYSQFRADKASARGWYK